MKKIIVFSFSYYPLVGGAEVAVKEITDRIDDIQFDMITLRFGKDYSKFEKIGNVNVYRIGGGKIFFPLFACAKACVLHKKNKYDLIWSIMAAYAGFAVLFFKLVHPRAKFLLTLQEGDPIDYIKKKVRFVYPLFKMIFTKADLIQAISRYLANWAKDMGFRGPVEVIPNGVDIQKFKVKSEKLKIKEERILITTSRLVKKNGISDVIKAMQYLPENVKFWIIGDGPERKNYELLITDYKLQSRVKFFGFLPHEKIVKYLHQADIFIRPSISEGMGNSFIEAMAAGVPVIATPVGGIPDFLKDRETGLFCEVNNPQSIADKIKIYLENRELREKIIANAQGMVFEKYDWEIIARDMREKVFGKILK